MDTRVKYGIVGVGAAVVGAIGGYFAGKILSESKIRDEYERELEATKRYYDKAYGVRVADVRSSDKTEVAVRDAVVFDDSNRADVDHYPYNTYVSETPLDTQASAMDIETITIEEFHDGDDGHEQSWLTYFRDGGVLDENEDFLIDWEALIGEGAPAFPDSGTLHIRNNTIGCNYEVTYIDADLGPMMEVRNREDQEE